ncbi:MAG: 2-hydroxyacid dehydrogenase [Spirochaetes bacterium]|nr:2-hydroxyacid dehydrogenase [Spirochaetota bacterium]
MTVKIVSMSPLNAEVLKVMIKNAGISIPDDIEIINVNPLPDPEIVELVRDAEIILGDYSFNKKISKEIAIAAKQVKLIQQPSVGYQHIDVQACAEAGIPVANTAGANTNAVAEHAIMAALCLLKKLITAHRTTFAGEWKQLDLGAGELSGKLWGIIGMGRIGRALAERLIPFGVRMKYHDIARLSAEDEKAFSAEYGTIDEIMQSADIISLHCPLTEETRGLIGEKHIAQMKAASLIINLSRGEIVDEAALARALSDGKIGGAALDVFQFEPINRDNPLLAVDSDKLILTPHTAGVTNESKMRIISTAINNIVNVLNGNKPDFIVNIK